jgi:hypothetical protein
MSPEATPATALSALLRSNCSDSLSTLLPVAAAELDRALAGRDIEPSEVAKRIAKRVNRASYGKADRLVEKKASPEVNGAAFDLRTMEADAGFALGVAYGLKLAGGAK